ncbi:DMT family transporter [Naumannella halotolerans]|uniref:EamA family transporter n=1 Tax=Naumannella halotolerans TaxID=993414 RepID=UPI00370D7A6F
MSPDTDDRRRLAGGLAASLGASVSNQTGAAVGALAFAMIGPTGVVAVRQVVTATALAVIARPRIRSLSRHQLAPALALAAVFSVMNISLYAAIDRIGLGLAVTIEFLGPLAVAVAASRKPLDLLCILGAGIGVWVLVDPSPTSDLLGIGLALLAATAWAVYILVNRTLGARLPGIEGTAVASILSAGVWAPIGLLWFLLHPPSAAAIALAAVCGLLASALPYSLDLIALRRIPAGLFGTITSVNPVLAALAGLLILGQTLSGREWLGIAIVVVCNIVVTARQFRQRRPGPAPADLDPPA